MGGREGRAVLGEGGEGEDRLCISWEGVRGENVKENCDSLKVGE